MNNGYVFLVYSISSLIFGSELISSEYHIKDQIPSYLYRRFDNVKEDIFPSEIRISMSLRRIIGILLYSIDRRNNQLIVTLKNGYESIITLYFRNKPKVFHITEICNCVKQCVNEKLDFIIRIKDPNIYIQCNNGSLNNFPYDTNIDVNDVYPLKYSKEDMSKSSLNEAHLWLVNDESQYQNPDHLVGCIFNVWYKNESINFTNISSNINQTCPILCSKNPCNGGECIETYNDEPKCDCTKAFGNGKYCNDSNLYKNGRLVAENLKFSIFKVSWNSSENDILHLSNNDVSLRIFHNGLFLELEYNNSKERHFSIKSALYNHYEVSKEYIFIATFNGSFINYLFSNGIKWDQSEIWSRLDLSKESFKDLSLQSGDGTINIVFKENPKDFIWKNITLKELPKIVKEKPKTDGKDENKYTIHNPYLIATLVIVCILFFVGNVFQYFKKGNREFFRKCKCGKKPKDESKVTEPGIPLSPVIPTIPSTLQTEESNLLTNDGIQNTIV